MNLKRFYADNFRNIKSCDICFTNGVNLLYGMNAQGKTNVVEGIYTFSRGRSFRTSEEGDMIKFGEEGFRIGIDFESRLGDESLEYALYKKERQRKKNGYKISRISEMTESFRAVLFSPDDLDLVKDGPEMRRAFLNIAASNCFPSYISDYSRFKKALENRSSIIKKASKGLEYDIEELRSWSNVIAEYASYIYIYRVKYIKMLEKHAQAILSELSSGRDKLSFDYKSDINGVEAVSDIVLCERETVEERYREIFITSLDREIGAGITLYGPQRDDLIIKVNGVRAASFCSQGQQRSSVLAMKLGEGEVIKDIIGEYPVFLFDDVLSELDEARRRYVIEGMKDRQIIITSCEKDEIQTHADLIIEVKGGEYVSTRR